VILVSSFNTKNNNRNVFKFQTYIYFLQCMSQHEREVLGFPAGVHSLPAAYTSRSSILAAPHKRTREVHNFTLISLAFSPKLFPRTKSAVLFSVRCSNEIESGVSRTRNECHKVGINIHQRGRRAAKQVPYDHFSRQHIVFGTFFAAPAKEDAIFLLFINKARCLPFMAVKQRDI